MRATSFRWTSLVVGAVNIHDAKTRLSQLIERVEAVLLTNDAQLASYGPQIRVF